jgi:hypothetical protein
LRITNYDFLNKNLKTINFNRTYSSNKTTIKSSAKNKLYISKAKLIPPTLKSGSIKI